MDSFYSQEELEGFNFKFLGKEVKVSRKTSLYGTDKMELNDYVRVDDFCILSGIIILGKYVHVAAYSGLFGGTAGIELRDFSGVSSKTTIYAVSDDYTGEYMAHPTINEKYRNVQEEKVILEEYVLVGCGTTILPGVTLKEGSAIGSMSLVKKTTEPWSINCGIPSKKIKERSKNLIQIKEKMLSEYEGTK